MNHWPFIEAAYTITAVGTIGLVMWSFVAMRRAEKAVDEMKEQ